MLVPNSPPPCRYCGHTEFVVSPNVHIAWKVMDGDNWNTNEATAAKGPWGQGDSGWGASFKGGVLVCTGCGHLELFMANPGEWTQALASFPWRMTRTPA